MKEVVKRRKPDKVIKLKGARVIFETSLGKFVFFCTSLFMIAVTIMTKGVIKV